MAAGKKLKTACTTTASEFDTTPDAVRLKYYREGGNQTKSHGNRLLTDEQDLTLKIVALAFSSSNLAWNMQVLVQAVSTLFEILPNRQWSRAWIQRHRKDLSRRKSKHLSKKRNSAGMVAEVCSFVDRVEAIQD